MQHDEPSTQSRHDIYWRKTRRLTALLLATWFVSTFCAIFFARELSHITLFGWPFPFYMASQGLIVLYTVIIGVYAKRMQRLDQSMKSEGDDGR